LADGAVDGASDEAPGVPDDRGLPGTAIWGGMATG